MDVVSFTFGTLAVVENLIHAYKAAAQLVRDVKNFDGDRETLIARILAEEVITLRLKALLFAAPETADVDNKILFRQLDEGAQRSLYAIFTLFFKAVDSYLPLDERYCLSDTKGRSTAVALRPRGDGVTALNATAPGGSPIAHASAHKMNRTLQQLAWALWDKKKVSSLIDEIEAWNKKITQLVQLHVLSRQVSEQRGQAPLEILSAGEAESLGIKNALTAQAKALSLPSTSEKTTIVDFERKWTELGKTQKLVGRANFEIGQFDDGFVLVDSKLYDDNRSPTSKGLVRQRMNELSSILQELRGLGEAVPDCLCWMNRLDRGTVSLLFRIPPSLEPRPQSLYDALPDSSLSSGPLLDERLEIAYQLASVLDQFHSVSWVHKSIRSENLLFFYTKSAAAAAATTTTSSEPIVAGKVLPPKWFLYGFEYARNMDAETSSKADTDPIRNTYRHPQRWGLPTTTFSPIHDIYALGVVLLELGIWRRATSMVKLSGSRPLDPFRVRSELIDRATRHLGYAAGAVYRDIVLKCLKGDFGEAVNNEGYKARMHLAASFRSLVVDELRALVFPNLEAGGHINEAFRKIETMAEVNETVESDEERVASGTEVEGESHLEYRPEASTESSR